MQSRAKTVEQYLAELPADRRKTLAAVRALILKNLDKGYEEGMQYGMIGYYVPHRIYPSGYHCDPRQPLPFAGLASQKNYCSLYLMCVYADKRLRKQFEQGWAAAGKKLNMGKSCVRFKKVDELALDVIATAIRGVTVKKCISHYESFFNSRAKRGAKESAGARQPAASRKKPRSTPKRAKSVKRKSGAANTALPK